MNSGEAKRLKQLEDQKAYLSSWLSVRCKTKNRLIAKNSKSQYIDKDFFGEVNKYNCFALVESAGQS
jgi:hypothetical protein